MFLKYSHKIRVAYSDTDQMGYVYYGQYARFFEVARTEALRSIGISYAAMEKSGVMMPVTNMTTRFVKAATYDELISIEVVISELPDRFMNFDYIVKNEEDMILCEAATRLVFVDADSRKVTKAPPSLINALEKNGK